MIFRVFLAPKILFLTVLLHNHCLSSHPNKPFFPSISCLLDSALDHFSVTFLGALICLLFALFFLPLSNKVSSQALSSIAYGISFFPGLTSEAVWSQELFFYLYRYKLTEKITLEISKERGSKEMSFRKMQERGKKGFPRLGKWDRSGYLRASCLHMATHSRTLAWKVPWTEEPGKLQSVGSQRVACHFHFPTYAFLHLEDKGVTCHSIS